MLAHARAKHEVPRLPHAHRRPRPLLLLTVLALGSCAIPDDPVTPDVTQTVVPAEIPVTPGTPPAAVDGYLELCEWSGENPLHLICWPGPPPAWNGAVIAYAHGYVPELGQGPEIPADELEIVAPFVLSQGFGFAATSYRTNGLAIEDGPDDMVALATAARADAAQRFSADPALIPVLLAGASEGGAVVTLAAENYAGVFQGALSTCGPTGSFQMQLDYFGHFNVLFNYFFPEVFEGRVTPAGVDPVVMQEWAAGVYQVAHVLPAVTAPGNAVKVAELLRIAQVAYDPTAGPGEPGNAIAAIIGILNYNVLATNDAIAKLGGRPFGNRLQVYRGLPQDAVERYQADWGARQMIRMSCQTTGTVRATPDGPANRHLAMPYVSLHTTGDDIVPYWHQPDYRIKAWLNGRPHSAFAIPRYGHCNFEQGDLELGLGLLIVEAGFGTPAMIEDALPNAETRALFRGFVGR